mmetsp:Transcript_6237/g.9933  ORF Transcript_6237/g.9933 Transcript_6237/m.9933 type:complete len:425 (-) Transcript_6237:96-1370(-)
MGEKGLRDTLEDLHLPQGRDASCTPQTQQRRDAQARAMLPPQIRSNASVIDDMSGAGLPRPRRGSQIQYMSSVFSPVEDGAGKDTTRAPGIGDKKIVATDATPKRRKRVLASYDDMKHVVEKLDTSRTGQITSRDLNNALGRLGIKMKRSDFRRLAGEVDPLACTTHLPTLGKVPEETARRWNENGQSSVRQSDLMMQAATAGAWRQRLESQVSRVWKQLQRDFKRLDPQRTSLIDMHILIPALSHYGINLQTRDADALYLQMGVGRSGKINYGEFLKCFVGGGLARQGAISAPPDLVTGSNSNKMNKHKGSNFQKRTDMGVPSDIEGYLRSATIHWRAIRQSCQIMDRGLTKTITKQQLIAILHKLGVSPPNLVLDAVFLRYKKKGPGTQERDRDKDSFEHAGDDLVEYNRFIKDLASLFPSM